MSDSEIQRTLGRIEGMLEANTSDLRNIREFFARHEHDDNVRFTEVRDDISKINKRVFIGSGAVATLISMVGIWLKGH